MNLPRYLTWGPLWCNANFKNRNNILDKCDFRLSATKTVICPKSPTILRWVRSSSHVGVRRHQVATLSSCHSPTTTKSRSIGGAYLRVFYGMRVATLLSPLDNVCAGRPSRYGMLWTDKLNAALAKAQAALQGHCSITLPKMSDQL